jgi:hypothetical protein
MRPWLGAARPCRVRRCREHGVLLCAGTDALRRGVFVPQQPGEHQVATPIDLRYDTGMNLSGLFYIANQFATLVIFALLAALSVRGFRRRRRWSLALIAVSTAITAAFTLLQFYQSLSAIFGDANQAAVDPRFATEAFALALNVSLLTGALLNVGLALEIAALVRGRKPTSGGSAGSTGD